MSCQCEFTPILVPERGFHPGTKFIPVSCKRGMTVRFIFIQISSILRARQYKIRTPTNTALCFFVFLMITGRIGLHLVLLPFRNSCFKFQSLLSSVRYELSSLNKKGASLKWFVAVYYPFCSDFL